MNELTIFNLSVKFKTKDLILINHIEDFIEKYYTIKQSGFGARGVDVKEFVSRIKSESTYYFHLHQFVHLSSYLESVHYQVSIDHKIDKRVYDIEYYDMELREQWIPRDYQVPIIEFLTESPKKSKLVEIQTGKGKGLITFAALAKLKRRVGVVILPNYIDKWVKETIEVHKADPSQIMVVQGSKQLRAIVELAREGSLDSPYIIFSSRTLQDAISLFESEPDSFRNYYGIELNELFSLLKIGVMVIDETHQSFHAMYKIIIHINVAYQIGLSATMVSDDQLIRRLHQIVYPKDCIYNKLPYDRYADIYAVDYGINPNHFKFLRTTYRGSKTYSHTAYEQSIVKNRYNSQLVKNYIDIILECVEDYYMADYLNKDKLLVFVATVEFATTLTEVLKEKYGHLLVQRYCEDDPFDNVINSDIVVSTLISAGTALDIKGLRTVVNTISISSTAANLQNLGRLRKLSDRDVKFCYLYSNSIAKQREYHQKRQELFKDKAKSFILRSTRKSL